MNDKAVFNTPVLFNIFNRLDTAPRVFEQIRKVKPKKLYIAADGPRDQVPGEDKQCDKVRKTILGLINWDCELHTLFREKNLGLKEAISSAISWMFETETAGIILEDDCYPEVSFFEYCQTVLNRYKDDENVMMLSGTNYIAKQTHDTDGIFFSRYFAIWGWATWRRAWKQYDKEMKTWPEFKKSQRLYELYPYAGVAQQLTYQFNSVLNGENNTWDYQWFYTCAKNGGVTVVPTKNLVSNIQVNGTHTVKNNYSRFRFMKTEPLAVADIVFPKKVTVDPKQELALFTEVELVTPFYWVRLLIKKLRIIKKKLLPKR